MKKINMFGGGSRNLRLIYRFMSWVITIREGIRKLVLEESSIYLHEHPTTTKLRGREKEKAIER